MKNYIYGAGGHGKVVYDAMQKSGLVTEAFIDDADLFKWMGLPVLKPMVLNNVAFLAVHLAVGSCSVREEISKILSGVEFLSIYHPQAVISASAKVKAGTFVAANAVIGPDAIVGEHCIINHNAVVDHDCVVADFCHIAPLVSLGGGVKVGRGVLVGAGSTVLPGLVIGDYAVIGAGAVVTKNIAPGLKVVGSPARTI